MMGVAQVIGMKPTLRENIGRGLERKELAERRERGRGTDRFQEGTARGVPRKHGAHDGRRHDTLVARVLGPNRNTLELPCHIAIVLHLIQMPPARAS